MGAAPDEGRPQGPGGLPSIPRPPRAHHHLPAEREEYDLYKAVTAYINDFLPQASGKKKQSVALARTVLQRRLASSTMAIYESIRRRLQKQQELLEELET